jgi:type I restriction enzyme S subunit
MAGEARSLVNKGWLYHPKYPDHWKRRPLYSLAEWVNGLAFRDIQFSSTGMPVIKIAEIKGGISGQTKFTQQTFDESIRVRPGDLLFSWSGQPETSIDAFWWRGPEGWLNQHVFRVTPADGIDPTFFYYLLRYLKPHFVGIARNKQTTGLGHVTKRDLENIEGAYPELAEQRAIAHILGTLDDKIELNRRMSETLEQMARALFKSWFVDFEPVRAKMQGRWRRGESLPGLPAHLYDLFPDRVVDSELGEIPEGWGVGTLGDVGEQLRETENPLESPDVVFHHFSIPAYDDGQWPKHEAGGSIKSLKSRVPPGVVLLSKLNPEIERVWLVDVQPDERAICSTEFIVLSPRPPYGRSFLYCLARSRSFRHELEGLVTGTSKSHQRAQVGAILKLPVVRAPVPLLSRFENAAETVLARSLACRRESRTLAQLRDTLLPKLISGELRVKDAERFVANLPAKQPGHRHEHHA